LIIVVIGFPVGIVGGGFLFLSLVLFPLLLVPLENGVREEELRSFRSWTRQFRSSGDMRLPQAEVLFHERFRPTDLNNMGKGAENGRRLALRFAQLRARSERVEDPLLRMRGAVEER